MPSLDDRLRRLKRVISGAPRTSGVYIMKDAAGREIYVGKAKDMRARLRQYFDLGRLDGKTSALMAETVAIETVGTPSEVEALLLESRLIKDLQPKFNVSLKGTSYPLVEITWGEPFPRVMVTRDRARRGSHYVGPFVDAAGLRTALALLRRVFRFCCCPSELPEAAPRGRRPCLDHHVGLCSAPCCDRIGKADYRAALGRFESLLKGRGRAALEAETESRMKTAARELDFEEAARLRDELAAVRSLARRGGAASPQAPALPRFDPAAALEDLARELALPAPPRRIEGLDLANLSGREAAGSIVTFLDGRPAKGHYRRYRIRRAPTDDDYAMMREVVGRRCRRLADPAGAARELPGGPDLLLLDGGSGHLAAGLAALKRCPRAGRPRAVCALSKSDETIHLPGRDGLRLPRTSPALKILQHVRDEAHRFAGQYHRKLREARAP
jgi:excinuclease ABC subunit C